MYCVILIEIKMMLIVWWICTVGEVRSLLGSFREELQSYMGLENINWPWENGFIWEAVLGEGKKCSKFHQPHSNEVALCLFWLSAGTANIFQS